MTKVFHTNRPGTVILAALCLCIAAPGLAFDRHPPLRDDGAGWAARNTATAAPRPREHRGVSIQMLGRLSEAELLRQTGLAGHVMQLRAITLEPGGQIAADGHAQRPGLIKVISGAWTEGRPGVERDVDAADPVAIPKGPFTRHWFFNRGQVPATALVFDIVAAD